jgi:uncharacterized membrane protein
LSSVTTLIVAFCIGIVAGLRTFTPMAALLLARGGIWAIAGIPAVLSAGLEFVSDIQPTTPSRAAPMGLAFRVVSGAAAGWMVVTLHDGSAVFGIVAGVYRRARRHLRGLAARWRR